jgi:phage tail sheath gpL-like
MTIPFSSFPATWRLPLYWVELNSQMAGTGTLTLPALLVGQGSSAATATPNVPVPVGDFATSETLFGAGSMLSDMFGTFFQNNTAQEIVCMMVPDPAGAFATCGISVLTPPTQAGTIFLYIAGQLVTIGVGATDSVSTVAANMIVAINAAIGLPCTAALGSSGGGDIDLTCKWKGATGNDITVSDSLLGSLGGQALPVGLTLGYDGTGTYSGGVTPANMGFFAGGTGVPSFSTGIANLGDNLYEYVALPYTDSGSLLTWETEYGFSSTGRWGWMRQLYGGLYSAQRNTYAGLLTFGASRNGPVTTVMDMEPAVPSPCWEVAAAYCAEAALALTNDPARPLQTLELQGVMPAPKAYRFLLTEINVLAENGIAVQHVDDNGLMSILREVTTYQFNAYGAPDEAYTDMTTPATLAKLLRNQRAAITTKFPRYKLADDGTLFAPGSAIVTPSVIKAELVAEYSQDEFNGLVEDTRAFATNLIVERDSTNPDRVNVLYPPNLIGQLRIFAVLAQFRLLGTQQTTVPA